MANTATQLDQAQAVLDAVDGSEHAQLTYYARLLDSELVLLLQTEPDGENIEPRVFDLEDGPVVLAFDLPERLADFVGAEVPSATLPGRRLIEILAGKGIGLGINLEVAPSATLLDAKSVSWLADMVRDRPEELQTKAREITHPADIPQVLLQALDAKLARLEGLAEAAYLVGIEYESGARGHFLALIDPVPGAQDALARAVSEALIFSGVEAGVLDTGFFRASDPICAKLAKVGLRFDIPEMRAANTHYPSKPGADPTKPPILR